MAWIRRLRDTVRSQVERDIDEELRFHIDARVSEYIARGMTEDEARRAALRRFGSVEAVAAETRNIDTFRGMLAIVRTAAVVLALVAGANAAVLGALVGLKAAMSETRASDQGDERWRSASCDFAVLASQSWLGRSDTLPGSRSADGCTAGLARTPAGDVAAYVVRIRHAGRLRSTE